METKIARIISIVMHPMFMLPWALLLMFNLDAYFVMILPEKLRWSIVLLTLVNNAIVPALLIWVMARKNLISSMEMPIKEERTYPFLICAIFYASTFFLLRNLGLPRIYYLFVIGSLILTGITLFINVFWKISVHMIGIGSMLGGFLALSYRSLIDAPLLLLGLMLAVGLTGFARLKLNTHSPAQVYVGFFTGLVVMGGMFLIL